MLTAISTVFRGNSAGIYSYGGAVVAKSVYGYPTTVFTCIDCEFVDNNAGSAAAIFLSGALFQVTR